MDSPESRRPADNDFSLPGDLDHGLNGQSEVEAPSVEKPLGPPGGHVSAVPAPPPEVQLTSVPLDRDVLTYETFYGLRERPFSPGSDSRFLYHSAAHDRTAQELVASIARRDRLAVITAEPGTGKTMLCRALRDRVDRHTFTSFVAEPFVTLEDVLRAILLDFGVISRADLDGPRLSEATRQELTAALHQFLRSLSQIDGFGVVFIDDAQTLSGEMLDQLQVIADADRSLMGIVLIGRPELLLTLGRRKSASGAEPVRTRLGPLAEDEIAGYVHHRLTVSGAVRLPIEFNSAALALVYRISSGVPHLVNLLCDRTLARGFWDSATLLDAPLVALAARDLDLPVARPITERLPRTAWMAVALVAVLLLCVAAGGFVFRAHVRRAIADWRSPPAQSDPAPKTAVPVGTR